MRKISRGSGFRGALNYAFDGDKDKELNPRDYDGVKIGGNMIGATPRDLAREFKAARTLRPDIEKPVWHNSLRLPAGEHITNSQWVAIADDYMNQMGFTELHQRVYILHDDKDGQHIHLIASRVSLEGKVFLGKEDGGENFKSTRVIAQLEIDHGLQITKGPALDENGKIVMPDSRAPAAGELKFMERTGELSAKEAMKGYIDAALKHKPTLPEFIETLVAAGVEVRLMVDKNGVKGASFELDGVAVSGSKLGDAYKWQGLQKRGLDYDNERDAGAVEAHRSKPANSAEAGRATGVGQSRGDGAGVDAERPAPDAARAGAGAVAAAPAPLGPVSESQDLGGAVRPAQRPAAPDAGRPDSGDGRQGHRELLSRGGEAGAGDRDADQGDQLARRDSEASRVSDEEALQAAGATRRSEARDDRRIGDDQGADTGPLADDRAGGSSGPDRRPDSGWSGSLARFKAASAARVRSAPAAPAARVSADVIADARSVDPTPFLESAGYTVKREGRHLSVRAHGDECYRITLKPDGHFVACDNYENGIGDNIALVQHVSGCGFSEAVHKLTGDYAAAPRVKLPEPRLTPPKLPPETPAAREQGTAYLTSRRITLGTIAEAVKAAFLRFVSGGVVFVGLDPNRRVRAATKRSIDPAELVQKRDFLGTDKRYAPILPGNPRSVWIVEGGVDALALHDLARQRGQEPPTVIVSGGSNVRGFLETPHILQMLERADRITIAAEREKNIEVQAKTDAQRKKLEEELERLTRKKPTIWTPPHGVKDMAEYHSIEQTKLEAAPAENPDNGLQGAGPAPAMPAPSGPKMG